MEKIKGLFKNRVVILGTILGLLILGIITYRWLNIPFAVVSCDKGEYIYSHTTPWTCSNQVIGIDYEKNHVRKILTEIDLQNNENKKYNRNNIAEHIKIGRNYISKYPNMFPMEWLPILIKIGHYEEAENYIKNMDIKQMALLDEKESCYDSNLSKIEFLSCLNQVNKRVAENEYINKDYWLNYIKQHKEDNPDINNKNQMNSYMQSGLECMKKNDYKNAVNYFEKVLEIQDYNYKAHEKLETCCQKLGNNKKANEHARIMKELLDL